MPSSTRIACAASNRRGQPCQMAALVDSDRCWAHDPARAAERAAARRKGGRNAQRSERLGSGTSAGDVSLQTARDILSVLERATADALATSRSLGRSRTIAYLASVALRSVELGALDERIGALEALMREIKAREVAHS